MIQRDLDIATEQVAVHAVGPGYGESVVITVGRRVMIGVDCCTALVQRDQSGRSYLEHLLARMVDEPYVCWLLTHFHYDHFQSLTALVDQLRPVLRRFIVPGDYLSADLAHHVAMHAREDEGTDAAFHIARDEYSRIRRRLEEADLARVVSASNGESSLVSLRLRSSSGRILPLEADLFGPTYQRAAALLGAAVDGVGHGEKKRDTGNHTSYILRVTAGRFQSVLLGDAPIPRSLPCELACRPRDGLFVLKIAHHGSIDGTDLKLLDKIGRAGRRRVALICPFTRHGLPQSDVVTMLRSRGYEVLTTGAASPSAELTRRIMANTTLPTNGGGVVVHPALGTVAVVNGRL